MTLELPLSPALSATLADRRLHLDRAALEGIALHGYRQGALSLAQVRELLGFATRWEAEAFLSSFGMWPDYDEVSFEAELQRF
jgi:Uncharacterised protein family (UPF0175)